MSIAVSAVVRRSGIFRTALLAMSIFCLCIGVLICFGASGDVSLPQRAAAGVFCLLASFAVLREFLRIVAHRRIDISGSGQIHVTALPSHTIAASRATAMPAADPPTYRLRRTSTLWSFLLVLDLCSDAGERLVLIVLPDTMTQASFRSLCVACRWIAAHNIRADAENS